MRSLQCLIGLCLVACYSTGEGKRPPLERIYFPVGLAINAEQNRLFVVSSDFDLQYNAGSVQAIDLDRVHDLLPRHCQTDEDCEGTDHCVKTTDSGSAYCKNQNDDSDGYPCGDFGPGDRGRRVIVPGPCGYVDLVKPQDGGRALLVDSVAIGAFATDLSLRRDPSSGAERLFIPVRGEASLHFVDIDEDGMMQCGQRGSTPTCDEWHRVGTDSEDSIRDVRMPAEPYALAATEDARAIAVTHQTSGEISLFVQEPHQWQDGPQLSFVHTGLASRPVAIVAVPEPALARFDRQAAEEAAASIDPWPAGFLVAYRNAPDVELLRFYADRASNPARPFLERAAQVKLTTNVSDYDVRGVAYDDSERAACEAECAQAVEPDASPERDCLLTCAGLPVDVYLATRSPASLVVGTTMPDTWATPSRDVPRFLDTIPLPMGPSRIYVGQVLNAEGLVETRVFVVCFDSRRIAIYDPSRRTIERWITTGRGPHAMAFDLKAPDPDAGEAGYSLAYVSHFTDSYLGVVELDRRHTETYGEVVMNLAPPTAPRASK